MDTHIAKEAVIREDAFKVGDFVRLKLAPVKCTITGTRGCGTKTEYQLDDRFWFTEDSLLKWDKESPDEQAIRPDTPDVFYVIQSTISDHLRHLFICTIVPRITSIAIHSRHDGRTARTSAQNSLLSLTTLLLREGYTVSVKDGTFD